MLSVKHINILSNLVLVMYVVTFVVYVYCIQTVWS